MTRVHEIIGKPEVVGRLLAEGCLSTSARNSVLRGWFRHQKKELRKAQRKGDRGFLITVQGSPEIRLNRDMTVSKVDDIIEILCDAVCIGRKGLERILYTNE